MDQKSLVESLEAKQIKDPEGELTRTTHGDARLCPPCFAPLSPALQAVTNTPPSPPLLN